MIQFKRLIIKDFNGIESANVPLDGQGLVLIEGDNQDTSAAESNGAGKSTIFDAIGWALFDKLIGDNQPTDVIRRGAKKCEVALSWEQDGTPYEVIRTRTKSGGKIDFKVDGIADDARKGAQTTERINDLLGLDWDTFRNTVFYGQGDNNRFADHNVTDAQRKGIMKRALGLHHMDKALKLCREMLREEREAFQEAANSLREARESQGREQGRLEQAQERHAAWGRTREAREAALQDDIDTAESNIESKRDEMGRLESLRETRDKALSVLAGRSDLNAQVDEVEQELAEREREHAVLKAEHDKAIKQRDKAKREADDKDREVTSANKDVKAEERELARLEKLLADFQNMGTCPVCKTPVQESSHSRAHMEQMKRDIEAQKGKVADAKSRVTTLGAAATALADAHSACYDEEGQAAAAVHNDASVIDAIKTNLTGLRDKIKKLDGIQDRVDQLNKRIEALSNIEVEIRAAEVALAALRERLASVRAESNPHTEALEEQQRVTEATQSRVDDKARECDGIEHRMRPLLFWEKGFSNKGLPSLALDSVLPIVNQAANKYLDILADGDIKVDILPRRELKAGGSADEITINTWIEGNDNVRPSGAQRSKIGIAIDLALMDLVATREGSQIDLLMIDEVIDGFDAEGRARVFRLLDHLKQHRSTVLVISHDPEVKEHFAKVWTVTRKGGASTVTTD